MSDRDRDRDPLCEPERVRETERTTVVHTGGGDRRGGGGLVIALVLLVAVVALLFYLFGGGLNRAADEVGVNVNVETPEIKAPDIDVKLPDVDVGDVKIPDVDIDTGGGGDGNKAE
jgi:hypothetical protein